MRVLNGVEEVRAAVGTHLGHSPYRTVTQADIDAFAALTGDDQWIHVDPARAASGPFGGTIAHGLLTLSLGPRLIREIYRIDGMRMGVNYGYDRIRFPSPVPVNSKIRVGADLEDATDIPGGLQIRLRFTWQIEGTPKPACIATMLLRYSV
ncbi:MaoC family dehydratase [Actinocorallia sp. A-T 12471]|uniref:MaoC family dehydratase n=1 Tax=Actinocorallia sp. A-T 12471 TaxID=3089813 RepID=UPI0029CCDE2A|nr:MaoC family dehydratase [Actinocorallia sp. A-T 12471]MDX6740961.1 MaoC family dehydratase [Actinocorallia sp. A-T 12471]